MCRLSRCVALAVSLLTRFGVQGAMFGHIDEQYTLPIGVMVEIDADAGVPTLLQSFSRSAVLMLCAGTITLLEAGVL